MQSEAGTVDYSHIKAIEGKTVNYTDDEYTYCKDFARKCFRPGVYTNQNSGDTIIIQHALGKLAELSVSKLLSKYECSKPDFTIGNSQAQFLPDLTIPPFNIHIKSVEPNPRYGIGFTFQYEEVNTYKKPRQDPIFESNNDINDIVICCTINRMNKYITVYDVNNWGSIKHLVHFDDKRDKSTLKGQKRYDHPIKTQVPQDTVQKMVSVINTVLDYNQKQATLAMWV